MARNNKKDIDADMDKNSGEDIKDSGSAPTADEHSAAGSSSPFNLNGYLFDSVAQPAIGDKLGRSYASLDAQETDPTYVGELSNIGDKGKFKLPGMLGLRYVPTFGIASRPSDPINRAGQQIIKDIQNALKRTNIEFQAIDVLHVIASLDSTYQLYNCTKRGYQMAQSYNVMNDYFPTIVGNALGIDIEDFRDNLADIYFTLKMWAASLAKYPVPDILNVFAVHGDMCTSLYTDVIGEVNLKAQLYGFAPHYLWRYPDLTDTTPDRYSLQKVEVFGATFPAVSIQKWSTIKSIMNMLIDRIANSDDFHKISAALFSTYPDVNVYNVTVPEIGSTVPVVSDPYLLEALCNAKLIPLSDDASANAITFTNTSNNVIETGFAIRQVGYKPEGTQGTSVGRDGRVLTALMNPIMNSHRLDVTSRDAVNMMRWHPACAYVKTSAADENGIIRVTSCGTEVLTNAVIYTGAFDGAGIQCISSNLYNVTALSNGVDFVTVSVLQALAAFNYHPIFTGVVNDTNTAAVQYNGVTQIRNWNYSWKVSINDLKNYHTALLWEALLPEFK